MKVPKDGMHRDLLLVFAALPDGVGVIGSAAYNQATAPDIDVLVPHTIDYKALVASLGVKYNGWNTPLGHVRRADIFVPGVARKVQVLYHDYTPTLADSKYEVLLADGTKLNEGAHFCKHDYQLVFEDADFVCARCGDRVMACDMK